MKENKNLKLYPKYRRLSMDFLFYYTINVLFLTQVKHIEMSAVVLVETFYALFVVLVQGRIANLAGKISVKRCMILGNLFNALYITLIICSFNYITLIIAEFTCAIGFSFKEMSEPTILNESINLKKEEKSKLFSTIQEKAVSGYYVLSAISMVLSGFLYEINGYIPIFISLFIVIITIIMSTRFENVESNNVKKENGEKGISFKEAMKFCFESKRCRCLLMFSGIFYGILTVLGTYEISLLEELSISANYVGIIFAVLNIISALSSSKQQIFQDKFKNRTLTAIGLLLVFSCIIAGGIAIFNLPLKVILFVILCMYAIKYITVGLYNVFLVKYLSNFTNEEIDTQIYSLNNCIGSFSGIIFGLIGSKLIDCMPTVAEAMMIFGIISFLIMVIILKYMKNKVGLSPEKYSEIELKYDKNEVTV